MECRNWEANRQKPRWKNKYYCWWRNMQRGRSWTVLCMTLFVCTIARQIIGSYRGVNVSTSHFARTKRETQRFFCYVGTAKCGMQTKFLTFQCNFRENLTFRSNETWNAIFFFMLDKQNVKRNNSVLLSFRTFDRSRVVQPLWRQMTL
jgi:hypothetical protein